MLSFVHRLLAGQLFNNIVDAMFRRKRTQFVDNFNDLERRVESRASYDGSPLRKRLRNEESVIGFTECEIQAGPLSCQNHDYLALQYGPFNGATPLTSASPKLFTFRQPDGSITSAITLSSELVKWINTVTSTEDHVAKYKAEIDLLGLPQIEEKIKSYKRYQGEEGDPLEPPMFSLSDLISERDKLATQRKLLMKKIQRSEISAAPYKSQLYTQLQTFLSQGHHIQPLDHGDVRPPSPASVATHSSESRSQGHSKSVDLNDDSLSSASATIGACKGGSSPTHESVPPTDYASIASSASSITKALRELEKLIPQATCPRPDVDPEVERQEIEEESVIEAEYHARIVLQSAREVVEGWPVFYEENLKDWTYHNAQGTDTHTKSEFDIIMLNQEWEATANLIKAENDLDAARDEVRKLGLEIPFDSDMRSGFGDYADDGYLESEEAALHTFVDKDRIYKWMEDDKSDIGISMCDEWESESIRCGDAVSVIAEGKDKKRIAKFEASCELLRAESGFEGSEDDMWDF